MDLRRLRYFVAVAEHGGFSAAARTLHLSQPALSLAVKDLEVEFGVSLFERLGRRVVLTAAGEALLDPARQTLLDAETSRAAVEAVIGVRAGRLAVAALPTLAANPVAPLIGSFRRLYPGVCIELAAPDDTSELHDLVRGGRCEIGFAGDDDRPPDLQATVIDEQRLLAIHPPGTAVADGPARLLGGLAETPIVATPVGTSTRRLLDQGFAGTGYSPDVVVVTAQREAVIPLVLAGAGSALVPEALARAATAHGAVVSTPEPAIVRRVCALCRPGPRSPAAHRLLGLAVGPPDRGTRRPPSGPSAPSPTANDAADQGSRSPGGHRSAGAPATKKATSGVPRPRLPHGPGVADRPRADAHCS